MGFTKHGMVTEESQSDFDSTKKVAYYDEKSPLIADEANKGKLKKPRRFEDGMPLPSCDFTFPKLF